MHTYPYISIYLHINIYIYISIYIYTQTHTHTYTHIHLCIFTSIFFIYIDIDMYFYIHRFVPQSWGTVITLYKYKCNSLSLQKSYPFHIKTFLVTDVSEKKIQLRFLNPWERIYKLKHSTGLGSGNRRLCFCLQIAICDWVSTCHRSRAV